jgi:hypothetical protein
LPHPRRQKEAIAKFLHSFAASAGRDRKDLEPSRAEHLRVVEKANTDRQRAALPELAG